MRSVIIIALACALLVPLVASAFVVKPIKGINKDIGSTPEVVLPVPNIAGQFWFILGLICSDVPDGSLLKPLRPGFCPEPEPPPAPGMALISEVAWMGSMIEGAPDADAEWMELWNAGGTDLDLAGWTLNSTDGTPSIIISDVCTTTVLPAGGFLLFVRDADNAYGVPADCTYSGALENGGEDLELRDAEGGLVDNVPAESGGDWPGGDNATKETPQRTSSETWITAAPTPGGPPALP